MKAPISVCLICRNNETSIEKCILSFRDYVQEVVVVDTGSTDSTPEIAKKYADIFEVYTDCNDPETGLINSFSDARSRSFELATQPWVMWVDSDDILSGMEKVNDLLQNHSPEVYQTDSVVFMFPYEYSYNEQGECTCVHYRERLVYNKQHFQWVNPVHEVLINKPNVRIQFLTLDDVVFKHQRQYINKSAEPGRNLRIIEKYVKEHPEDPRQLYYYGLELFNVNRLDEAYESLSKYVSITGWEDEKCSACLKLVDLFYLKGDYQQALNWAFKSVECKEHWSECYFAVAKIYYFLAQQGGVNERRLWEKVIHFAEYGLSLPPTNTVLFINPQEKAFVVHQFLNVAYSKIGDCQKALDSVNAGLKAQPSDSNFLYNKKIYENLLFKNEALAIVDKLQNSQIIEFDAANSMRQLIRDGKTDGLLTTENKDFAWKVPSSYDFNNLPIDFSDDQLQTIVIAIWKQYMLHNEVLSAIKFLENAPYRVRHTFLTEKALATSKASCVVDGTTYECLKDPVSEMLVPAKQTLKSGEKFSLTIPHGSRTSKWSMSNSCDKLVAPTVWSVAEHFKQAGYWVKNSYVKLDDDANDELLDDIFAEALVEAPVAEKKLDIVFYAGQGLEEWTPETIKKTGIGGSELMMLNLSKLLTLKGHRVRVYNSCGKSGEGIYDGVEYYHSEKYQDLNCDVLVVSRLANMLDDAYNIQAKIRLLWCHDVVAVNGQHRLLLKADRILALSNWHKQFMVDYHNIHPNHVIVTRNGIDLKRFDKKVERDPYRCFNSSSPDRSYHQLLTAWSEIRRRVNDKRLSLHLYYGFKGWDRMASVSSEKATEIAVLKQRIANMASEGVVFHDRVDQEQLAEGMLKSSLHLYNSDFTETSCISAMEAQAAGCKTICSALAALNETVGNRGILLAGSCYSEEYREKFVSEAVRLIKEGIDEQERVKLQGYAREHFCLDKLADEWEEMFYSLIEEVKKHPITQYQPTENYK